MSLGRDVSPLQVCGKLVLVCWLLSLQASEG